MLLVWQSRSRLKVVLCSRRELSRMSNVLSTQRVMVASSMRSEVRRNGMSKRTPLKAHRLEASSKASTLSSASGASRCGASTRVRANS